MKVNKDENKLKYKQLRKGTIKVYNGKFTFDDAKYIQLYVYAYYGYSGIVSSKLCIGN